MLNVEREFERALKSAKRTAPQAFVMAKLVKLVNTFDPSTNKTTATEQTHDVEVINDTVTQAEIEGFGFLISDFKFHVIAEKDFDVDFYDMIKIDNAAYPSKNLKIVKKKDILIGVSSLMFTIVAR